MKIKPSLIFPLLICSFMAAVVIIQVVYELKQNDRIQCFDIIYDTFIFPGKRNSSIYRECNQLRDTCNALRKNVSQKKSEVLNMQAEDILTRSETLRRVYREINRYVSDSLSGSASFFDTTVDIARNVVDAIDESDTTIIQSKLVELGEMVDSCSHEFKARLSPIRRTAEVFYTLFKHTIFKTSYIRAYEKELEKRSVVAQTLRPLYQFTRYKLLHDAGDKAIIGNSKWLFYRPDVEYCYKPSVYDVRSKVTDFKEESLTDNPVEVMLDFKKQLAERGVDLLIMIVPGKPSIYPDLLTSKLQNNESVLSPTRKIFDSLKTHGIDYVDLFAPFLHERKSDGDAGDSLYMATDTHWKNRAVRLAAKCVAERIAQYPWINEEHRVVHYTVDSVTIGREGDIGSMTDLPDNPFKSLRVDFLKERTICHQVFALTGDAAGTLNRERYKDNFKEARILVIGDSFSRIFQTDSPQGAGWIAHLACELSEPLSSLVNDGGASTLVREKLARKSALLKNKRLIVWEFVERDIRFGSKGWKKVQLP